MWRTVFHHDFPDASIRNFHAPPGRAFESSLALTPEWDAQDKRYGLVCRPQVLGTAGFVYVLDDPVPDAIGVSLRARARLRVEAVARGYALFELGSALSVGLQGRETDSAKGKVSIAFRLGNGPRTVLGEVSITTTRPVVYRIDWHASGQLKVYLDGALVAYDNAVHPGAQFAFDRLSFGMTPFHVLGAYTLTSASVKCLQRETMLRKLERTMPTIPIPAGLARKCRTAALDGVMSNAARIRAFMAKFHVVASQPWVQSEGSSAAPFSASALEAHTEAVKAGAELGKMMRTWEFSDQGRFLDPLEKLLRITRASLPEEFASLAADITQRPTMPVECIVPSQQEYSDTRREYAGFLQLMEMTEDLILTVAQGS